MQNDRLYNPYVSIDCVVFGFDGKNLKLLLVKRHIEENNGEYNDQKLPGGIIYMDEDLDDAASRVLEELTGIKNIPLSQFYCFGHPRRTSDARDILWLERTMRTKIERIVSVGYVALIKINRKITLESDDTTALWADVSQIEKVKLAMDHNLIAQKGLEHIKHWLNLEPHLLFKLLPRKFTLLQLRLLYDEINQTKSDVRNFQKKIANWNNLEMLDEFEQGVSHRAARLYKYKKD